MIIGFNKMICISDIEDTREMKKINNKKEMTW